MPSVDTMITEVTIGRRNAALCSPDLAEGPWEFESLAAPPAYGPGCSQDDVAPPDMPRQGVIPERYRAMAKDELVARIRAAKEALGERLVVLGHHYQRDEIIQFADFTGDSFKLARLANTRDEAEFIVFCGVHFMAETADVLAPAERTVILPNMQAGCSMADMADLDSVLEAWEQLQKLYAAGGRRGGSSPPGPAAGRGWRPSPAGSCGPPDSEDGTPVVPVTYMNSSAVLKAFCGENGGIVCTSGNAAGVLEWAFGEGNRVLFFPDQHLGRNTGARMGIPIGEMPVWDPTQPLGGNDEDTLRDARMILWKGWCSVHVRFTPEQVAEARAAHPAVRILVHPECPDDVVDLADAVGSTEHIIELVDEAPPGTVWGIGTEINLVRRLADRHPEQTIFCLDPVICPCSTMYRIHPSYLCWVLESLVEGRVENEIRVDGPTREWAKVALERMLAVPPPTADRG